MINLFKGIKGILFIAFMGFMCILSTQYQMLSIVITAFQYIIVFFFIVREKFFKAFVSYMVFTSVSLEMDFFIYYGGIAPFERYSFFNPYLVYKLMSVLLLILVVHKYHHLLNSALQTRSIRRIYYWLITLLVTGIISVFIGLALGDNVNTFGAVFNRILNFLVVFSIILISFILLMDEYYREEISRIARTTLAGVTLSAIISILAGHHGYYGTDYEIMLAPMLSSFSPCLILFYKDCKKTDSFIYLILALIIVVLSFYSPAIIGSKWYLIILASILYFVYRLFPKTNPVFFVIIALSLMYAIPIISDTLFDIIATDKFNEWKFRQAMGSLNIFAYNSLYDWFMDLEESSRFRIDEPINIAIEYLKHPLYILFGKGLGGTTQHYTPFCDWTALSAFSVTQQRTGHFYEMHETFGVLFLQHGILGIAFLLDMLFLMFRRIGNSPYAIWGALWLFFYWSYGYSFSLGVIALVLAIYSSPDFNNRLRRGIDSKQFIQNNQ